MKNADHRRLRLECERLGLGCALRGAKPFAGPQLSGSYEFRAAGNP